MDSLVLLTKKIRQLIKKPKDSKGTSEAPVPASRRRLAAGGSHQIVGSRIAIAA
jgi:hypothetical protein